ncbi:MAG: hypothetical protein Q8T08_13400, partial [Ignavibacteria bacterium]|nr:hypothetical protein [Ignavibacteria bacterium]
MKIVNSFFSIVLLLIFLASSSIFAQVKQLERKPLTFDFGKNISAQYLNSVVVDEKYKYNTDSGYGWNIAPINSFERIKFNGTTLRNNLTIDGVIGKEIEFSANIQEGKWWFTFWMEAGNDYNNSASLKVNNDEKKINWFRVKAGEGGESEYLNIYRVYHTLVEVGANGITFNLKGGKDSVRVLGLSLIPYKQPVSELHQKIFGLVSEAGKYKSKINLGDLQKYLTEQFYLFPDDSYIYNLL